MLLSLLLATSCTEQICAPGGTQVCLCPGGASGARSCALDGASWGECVCLAGDDDSTPPQLGEEFEFGDIVTCADPVEGFDRLREEGAARGLLPTIDGREGIADVLGQGGWSAAAEDLDNDGDIDLALSGFQNGAEFYANQGDGTFEWAGTVPPIPGDSGWMGAMVVDLDGDFLPELFLSGLHRAVAFPNLGGMEFGPPFELPMSAPGQCMALAAADADLDGDLDVAVICGNLPVLVGGGNTFEDSPDTLLLGSGGNDDPGGLDGLSVGLLLLASNRGSISMAGTFSDRDLDGDPDLYIVADNEPPSAFWRNDGVDESGLPIFVDDAAELGADVVLSGMGIDSADLNGDGLPDYCLTDTAPPYCLVSTGDGYVESGLALGIVPGPYYKPGSEVLGWGIDFQDIDGDGNLDVTQSGGAPDGNYIGDLMWAGKDDGTFEDVSLEAGFFDERIHVGQAVADFDGDGWLDIAVTGLQAPPLLYMNRCGAGGWLSVELRGSPGNTSAIGARVEAQWGDERLYREVHAARGAVQSPSLVHLTFGDVHEIDRLIVRWPDGTVSQTENLSVRRKVEVVHPWYSDEGR